MMNFQVRINDFYVTDLNFTFRQVFKTGDKLKIFYTFSDGYPPYKIVVYQRELVSGSLHYKKFTKNILHEHAILHDNEIIIVLSFLNEKEIVFESDPIVWQNNKETFVKIRARPLEYFENVCLITQLPILIFVEAFLTQDRQLKEETFTREIYEILTGNYLEDYVSPELPPFVRTETEELRAFIPKKCLGE